MLSRMSKSTESDNHKQDIIAYIYCSINDRLRQTTIALLSAILKQIVMSGNADVYKKAYEFRDTHSFNPPGLGHLSAVILDIAKGTNNLFIIVDAIDELQSPQHLLDTLSQLQLAPQVKVLCITRPRQALRWPATGDLDSVVSVQSSPADLLVYFTSRLDEVKPTKYDLNEEVRSQIAETIVAKSENWYVNSFMKPNYKADHCIDA